MGKKRTGQTVRSPNKCWSRCHREREGPRERWMKGIKGETAYRGAEEGHYRRMVVGEMGGSCST
jgi:hypothetical protein